MFLLVPPAFKATINMTIKASIFCEIAFIVSLVIMTIAGILKDFFSTIIFSGVFLSIIPLAMIPCLRYYKISQSSVEISGDRIRVVDQAGICWREIHYDTIDDIRVQNISGFFYGQDRYRITNKYICVFLTGCTEIPDVSYAKLFTSKDVFIFHYHENAIALLSCAWKTWGSTGDGSVC